MNDLVKTLVSQSNLSELEKEEMILILKMLPSKYLLELKRGKILDIINHGHNLGCTSHYIYLASCNYLFFDPDSPPFQIPDCFIPCRRPAF